LDTPTGPATSPANLIIDALEAVFAALDDAPNTARTRELRVKARYYERVVQDWPYAPPSTEQLDAMLDVVTHFHVHAEVIAATRGILRLESSCRCS
jgi:hypothetical protein